MSTLGNLEAPARRERDGPPLRTKGQVEAEISKGMIRFEREQLGRGPADIRTQILQDMVIVRMADMLTPAERALIRAGCVDMLRQVRTKLIESGHDALCRILREATGCEVATMYSDICCRTGEQLIVFVLRETSEVQWQ